MLNSQLRGGTNINFNFGGQPQSSSPFGNGNGSGFGSGMGMGMGSLAGGPMAANNPMMALGQQSQMMSAMMDQMMTMMGMVLNMMMMKQMQGMLSSSPAFGGGSGGGTPGLGNFLGGGGGQSPAASGGSGGGQTPAASGAAASSGEKTGNLVDMGGGKKLDSSIAANVKRMMADAKKDGINLQITSGHRSHAEQEVLYQKYKNGTGNLAAKPGTSNHESGRAIDFTNTPGAHAWLAKNAGRYGLKNLPGEPWHYSPNGK